MHHPLREMKKSYSVSNVSLLASILLTGALLGTSVTANAVPVSCTGISGGTPTTDDVTLDGVASDACIVSGVNPQQGPDGDTSGFSGLGAFGAGWQLLAKIDQAGGIVDAAGGPPITIGFSKDSSGKTGNWNVTSSQTGAVDLVFAMHAGSESGAFLFDDESLTANLTKNGTWAIEWLNGGGQVPGYSNLTIFYRDAESRTVPLPGTLLLLAAAGLAGVALRRRSSARG